MKIPKKCRLCIDIKHNIRNKKCTKCECGYWELQCKLATEVKLSRDGCFMLRK